MSITSKPLAGGVGLEIVGLDPTRPASQTERDELNRLWLEAGILLFRGIGTSPEVQLEISRCFGELDVHPIESIRVSGYPELIWLSNMGKQMAPVYYYDDQPTIGRIPWHTDLVYTTTPNRGALLRMLEMPAEGGETGWVDTAMAYDALSDEMKERIEGLEVLFEFVLNPEDMRFGKPENMRCATNENETKQEIEYPDFPDIIHPLVWTHPISGRKALNISPLHLREVVGLPKAEGDAILDELVAHATKSEFYYVHKWEPNDMVLWDNLRTMHKAFGNPPEVNRLVHRTTIKNGIQLGRVA